MSTSPLNQGLKAPDPCRILLVEDDPDDRTLEKKELESSDKIEEVLCFQDGRALMDYLESHGFQDHSVMCMTPTIIVIDLNMPRMNGFEILKELKQDTFLEEIPIVVVSSDDSPEAVREAARLKADGFFKKPLQAEGLRKVLDRAWRWPPPEMWMN